MHKRLPLDPCQTSPGGRWWPWCAPPASCWAPPGCRWGRSRARPSCLHPHRPALRTASSSAGPEYSGRENCLSGIWLYWYRDIAIVILILCYIDIDVLMFILWCWYCDIKILILWGKPVQTGSSWCGFLEWQRQAAENKNYFSIWNMVKN